MINIRNHVRVVQVKRKNKMDGNRGNNIMNEIYEYVKELNENVVVAVYCDRTQPCKCSVGYIRYVNESHIVLKHIDPNGLEDGYVLRNFDDIYRIDYIFSDRDYRFIYFCNI